MSLIQLFWTSIYNILRVMNMTINRNKKDIYDFLLENVNFIEYAVLRS